MATLRDIKRKIDAVKKTKQITRAMNMVAAAKLRGAQTQMEEFRPYAQKFNEVLANLAARVEGEAHPLLAKRDEIKKIEIVLITSDRGLCGSFNANLIMKAEELIKEKSGMGAEIGLIPIGRKGRDYFKRRKYTFRKEYIGVSTRFDINSAEVIANDLIQTYLDGETDQVFIIYSTFINMIQQLPLVKQLIPIEPPKEEEGAEGMASLEYLYEPSAETLLYQLLPRNVQVQVYHALLENSTSEHAARMRAMDNATNNCSDMIHELTLVYNKARQAAITKELMDIVGGAEALKRG